MAERIEAGADRYGARQAKRQQRVEGQSHRRSYSPSGRCVSHDVASDGFLGVRVEHTSGTVNLGHDLVGDDDSDAKLREQEGVEIGLANKRGKVEEASQRKLTSSANRCSIRKNLAR